MDWNQPPGQGPNVNLDEVAAKLKQKAKSFKSGGGKALAAVVVIILIIVLGSSAYFTIEPEETGVVQRFGKYNRSAGPGLNFKLPFGIETVTKVKTGRVFKEEFGFRATLPGIRSQFATKGYDDEALMLTGDLNVAEVKWIVQYRIREPQKWLFNVRDGRAAIRDLSESVMRRFVGNSYSDDVLTVQRVEIAASAQKTLQDILNSYHSGIQVVTVKLQDVNPPVPVQPAFNEVNEARQEKERIINQAQSEYNKMVPKAEGQARQTISEAEGYAVNRTNRAKGEAERFLAVLSEYQMAKEVTRKRLYLESMTELVGKTKRIFIVDEAQKSILPLLKLEEDKK